MGQWNEDCIHLAEDRVYCNLELNMAVNLWGTSFFITIL
jgi:hypothetical protein